MRIVEAMKGNIEKYKNNYIVIFSKTLISDPLIQDNINVRTFMAKCRKDEDDYISNCLDFFFYNWSET
ncbi:MAG: hypothetical protein ACR5LG_04565 [Sodalis sp. (in: enterobacteria)]|uniref:hypothetical protein n=1 Tax=Sodalis sp. (in: enterobacteria) TaxID=1898979 RepID=UPI003F394612